MDGVEWVLREDITPNDYNPNHVARDELRLLKLSILADGWTQPVVILPDRTLVDGYHRWLVSGDPEMRERFKGYLPAVTVDLDEVHRKASTVRHNRARGHHGVLSMANIVRAMRAEGVSNAEIMRTLGMERIEVERLLDTRTIAERVADSGAVESAAWESQFSK